MNTDDVMKLTAEELRLEIAKAKGWRVYGEGTDRQMIGPPLGDKRLNWAAEWDENGIPNWMENWPADIAAAWELESELTASEDVYSYCRALNRIVNGAEDTFNKIELWLMIHATPEQRCRAWVIVHQP